MDSNTTEGVFVPDSPSEDDFNHWLWAGPLLAACCLATCLTAICVLRREKKERAFSEEAHDGHIALSSTSSQSSVVFDTQSSVLLKKRRKVKRPQGGFSGGLSKDNEQIELAYEGTKSCDSSLAPAAPRNKKKTRRVKAQKSAAVSDSLQQVKNIDDASQQISL